MLEDDTPVDSKLLLDVDKHLNMLSSTEIKILAPLQLAWAMVRYVFAANCILKTNGGLFNSFSMTHIVRPFVQLNRFYNLGY